MTVTPVCWIAKLMTYACEISSGEREFRNSRSCVVCNLKVLVVATIGLLRMLVVSPPLGKQLLGIQESR